MADAEQPGGPFHQQPSSRWCFVCGVENDCGLKIRFFNDGFHRSIARVTLDEHYQSYPGIAHGGILATILDETMGRAILAEGDEPREITAERFMFSAKIEIRYRKSVPLHQEFVARGRVEKDRGRIVLVSGDITLADGTIAVEASATLADIPPDQMDDMRDQAGDLGWRVYP
jgi:acyl-coenzyme A thioesterase PaaI-like protein